MTSFPPLAHVPEPPIFDAPYYAEYLAIFDDTSFPPTTSTDEIYDMRRQFVASILASRKESSRSLSIALLVAWVSMVLLCGVLLVRIRRNRRRALQGDALAARRIVLPAFEPLLWTLGILNFVFIVGYGALLVVKHYVVYHNRVAMELTVSAKQINALLVVAYMTQPSLTPRALVRAMVQAFVLSGYTVPVVVGLDAVATPSNQRLCYWALLASRLLLGIYLVYLLVRPPARASDWSFRRLCLYVLTMGLLMFGMAESYHRGRGDIGKAIGWTIAGYSMLLPLSVWHVLRTDTEHWRGVGKRAVELQDTFRRKSGKVHERVSSQGLHVLIEMHRKFIIDFARLQLYEPITASGSVTVYRGFLHSKRIPVAIKVNMPSEFTDETVAAFSHEAAMCGALVHPNIVTFHGLCVCPPNICLVTELCQSSLADVLKTEGNRPSREHSSCRQQALLNIGYMLDAARALAYLHSFSPAFVHCDIKPSSFLVDDHGTVKLTDFGASQTLAVHARSQLRHLPQTAETGEGGRESSSGPTVLEMPLVRDARAQRAAEYMAPEVIHGHHSHLYGEAADVYALAMTMWDILHPNKTKYPLGTTNSTSMSYFRRANHHAQCHQEVYELVLAGYRPPMDATVHSGLQELIRAAWHANPCKRPTAHAIVVALENIERELCAPFALALMDEWNDRESAETMTVSSFAGAQAISKLRSDAFVASESEAIHVGNMLMDCGFLHHTKHARSFESTRSKYVFDIDEVLGSQRVAVLESTEEAVCGGELVDEVDVHRQRTNDDQDRTSARSSHVVENHCACRKLGQRMEPERAPPNRFGFKLNFLSHENAVTARLLASDPTAESEYYFTAFRDPSKRRKQRRDVAPPNDVV